VFVPRASLYGSLVIEPNLSSLGIMLVVPNAKTSRKGLCNSIIHNLILLAACYALDYEKIAFEDMTVAEEWPESVMNNDTNISGLRWVNLSVQTKKKKLLHPSHGFIPSGKMCGVIGPSGAGKSTFLSALAGTTPHSSSLHLTGSVWLTEVAKNGNANQTLNASYLSNSEGEVALLQQDDSFFSMLTPKETIELAAILQLPSSKHERQNTVDNILGSLGLKAHENRRIGERVIGSSNKGGLSGGERRRLSVGVELVTAPKVFLADEATTGLDSTQAEKVVALMRRTSRERNIPCICTLHQPRASIWRMLDYVILLSPGGRMCYIGTRQDAVPYFAKLGYDCPPQTNPAEFLIDLVSVDHEDETQAARDTERIAFLARKFSDQTMSSVRLDDVCWRPPKVPNILWQKSPAIVSNNIAPAKRVSVIRRFFVLLKRAWRQNIRDAKLNLFRLLASVGQAFLFSQIFRTVKPGIPTARSIADRTALLSFGVINMSMVSSM